MLSTWRWGSPTSVGSDFTGVTGGDASLKELELARERERAEVEIILFDLEIERAWTELELLALLRESTREGIRLSVVKNWRISSLRF